MVARGPCGTGGGALFGEGKGGRAIGDVEDRPVAQQGGEEGEGLCEGLGLALDLYGGTIDVP